MTPTLTTGRRWAIAGLTTLTVLAAGQVAAGPDMLPAADHEIVTDATGQLRDCTVTAPGTGGARGDLDPSCDPYWGGPPRDGYDQVRLTDGRRVTVPSDPDGPADAITVRPTRCHTLRCHIRHLI